MINQIIVFPNYYIFIWLALFGMALLFLLAGRKEQILFSRNYWLFLAVPWKLICFVLSGLTITFMAPYTDDPTWDRFNGFFMSVLAYATAPWAIGMLYQSLFKTLSFKNIFVSLTILLFSSSWSYDIYLFWRDGFYPTTWFTNLLVSSVIYVCAGLFWSLAWNQQRGVHFAFTESGWPGAISNKGFSKIFWYAVPFALLAGFLTVGYLRIFH